MGQICRPDVLRAPQYLASFHPTIVRVTKCDTVTGHCRSLNKFVMPLANAVGVSPVRKPVITVAHVFTIRRVNYARVGGNPFPTGTLIVPIYLGQRRNPHQIRDSPQAY